MKSYLQQHNFTFPNTCLIPNGVNITHFHPTFEDTFDDERKKVVICVSRLSYEKGIDVLLQAWYIVQKKVPEARLIIVGLGPLREQLEQMALVLNIAHSVEFTGLQEDVLGQLNRGRVAVLPSRWEGMPVAVLEAMACGLPCVATRVSGSEDIITNRVNGLLVDPEDYQSLAQALLLLLQDPTLAQKYGQAARVTIEQDYSLEAIIDKYIEIYQLLVQHKTKFKGELSTRF